MPNDCVQGPAGADGRSAGKDNMCSAGQQPTGHIYQQIEGIAEFCAYGIAEDPQED
jgi:hypothetical protein